jgi:serine/threonine protein kinase
MSARRRFRLIKELASGGFGTVYLAEMISGDDFSKVVALKVLHGRWTDNVEIVQRSRDEARLLGRLRHRNIVQVEDLTSLNGQCAVVMEYLEGADFKTLVNFMTERGEGVPLRATFEAVSAVAAALHSAWTYVPLQGGEPLHLIHRDIKPSNVFLTTDGDVKLLDFGTARANFESREAHTQALAFGSQAYMPPERLMGDPDTPAGDVFSLGITTYEILVGGAFGKVHLRKDRYEQTLERRLAALQIDGLAPELSERVLGTLRAMLAFEPRARPTAQQVCDIMEILGDESRDVGLRRFARHRVRQAMETLPHTPTEGSMEGQVLSEDASDVRESQPTWGDALDAPEPGFLRAGGVPLERAGTDFDQQEAGFQPIQEIPDLQQAHTMVPDDDPPPARLAPPLATPLDAPEPGLAESTLDHDAADDLPPRPFAALEPERAHFGGASDAPLPSKPAPPPPLVSKPLAPKPAPAPEPAPSPPPTASAPPPAPEPAPEAEPPAPPPKKSRLPLLLGGGLVVLALGLAASGGVWFLSQREPAPPPVQDTPSVASPDAKPPEEPTAPLVDDLASPDPGNGNLALELAGGGLHRVSLTGGDGTKVEVTGRDRFGVGNLPAGTYRTKVQAVRGGATVRGTLTVQADVLCSWSLDPSDSSAQWGDQGCL